jgi:hypothetical protein
MDSPFRRISPDELQSGGCDESVKRPAAYRQYGASMAEVFAQILQPESIRNQRRLCFDDDQVFRSPTGSDLQNYAGTMKRRSGRLNP